MGPTGVGKTEVSKALEMCIRDRPYLSLGADLTPDQRATVLGFMGIELTDLDNYDVVRCV